jgi:hypothetical protein
VEVRCQLSGPQPWNANGEASISFFFFSITVGFDETWGDDAPALPQQEVNVLDLVAAAVGDDRNWRGLMPANTSQMTTMRKTDPPPNTVLLHPLGVLSVSQKIAPLDFPIERFGNARPTGDTTFALTWTGADEPATEEFAVANFLNLSDSQKLSRKSFDTIKSGLRYGAGDGTLTGAAVEKAVVYERSYLHRNGTQAPVVVRAGIVFLPQSMFNTLSRGGAIAENPLSAARRRGGNGPAAVDVPGAGYQVVNISDLSPAGPGASAPSETEAYALHDAMIRNDASLAGNIQVMASHEIATAKAA